MSYSTRDHSVAAAFAENGIGREGGDGSAQRGRSVIYDCLVNPVYTIQPAVKPVDNRLYRVNGVLELFSSRDMLVQHVVC